MASDEFGLAPEPLVGAVEVLAVFLFIESGKKVSVFY